MDKMIKTLKKRYENKENHGRYGKKFSAESRKKISDSQKEYYKTHPSVFKGRKHTPESIRLIFENKPMNLLEKKVAEYLDTNKIEYIFQFFINESGVCKSYDFKIKHLPLILEIHGDYWHGGPGVKQHVFNVNDNMQNDSIKVDIARKRGYDVISIWESEIKNDINIISTKLTQYLSKKSV
jgi:G:T-mismatch repair DNA endonuclease (very short patch repair protein)